MRNILITGASRGLGKSLSDAFRQDGYNVSGTSSSEYNFLSKERVAACFADHKHCDILINNAGICEELLPDHTVDEFEAIFQINYFSSVQLALLFSEHWKASGINGKIINVLSRVARKGSINAPHYASSKAALQSFTNSWGARMILDKIEVFGIAPSWIETDILQQNMKDVESEVKAIPAKRFLEPNEMYPYFKFLVEQNCSYMTGQVIDVNGASYFR